MRTVTQNRSGEDREWIAKMLAKDSTRIVSSQQVLIVAPTPSGHQDAGTIKLDPEARRKEEVGREKEKKKENNKAGKEVGKGKTREKGKGKGKIFRSEPPVTRARKRSRKEDESPETRTASQDSCTLRNPLRPPTPPVPTFSAGTQERHLGLDTPATPAKNNPFRPSEGYTPPPPHPPPATDENTTKAANTIALIKTALGLTKDIEHKTPAKKLIWGLVELAKAGTIPLLSIQDIERLDKGTMDKAQLTCLVDEHEEQRLEGNATKKDLLKLRDKMAVQHHATF